MRPRRCRCWTRPSVGSWPSAQHTTVRLGLLPPAVLPHCPTEQFLQSPLQLEHACNLLIESELFEFHSERMLDIIIDDAQTVRPAFIYAFPPALMALIAHWSRLRTRIQHSSSTRFSFIMDSTAQTFSGLTNAGSLCCRCLWIT